MRSFQQHLDEFTTRGIKVVAISVDPSEVTRAHCAKQGYTYTFLSDANAEIIRRYHILHPRAAPDGHDIARPAEFLIDPTGTIRWVNLTESVAVRARPEQVLKAFDNLAPAAAEK